MSETPKHQTFCFHEFTCCNCQSDDILVSTTARNGKVNLGDTAMCDDCENSGVVAVGYDGKQFILWD